MRRRQLKVLAKAAKPEDNTAHQGLLLALSFGIVTVAGFMLLGKLLAPGVFAF